jgi:uncharacterized protein (TIGR00251 family)
MSPGLRAEIERILSEKGSAAVLIPCQAQPRASKNKIAGVLGGRLKITLTAPPVDNSANDGLIVFLAKKLGVPKSSVEIVSGQTGKKKLLRVLGVSKAAAAAALAAGPDEK